MYLLTAKIPFHTANTEYLTMLQYVNIIQNRKTYLPGKTDIPDNSLESIYLTMPQKQTYNPGSTAKK